MTRQPGDDVYFVDRVCIEHSDACRGPVEYRVVGRSSQGWPRCEHHFELRLDRYENSIERWAVSDVPPPWFDPSLAGERWNEDD